MNNFTIVGTGDSTDLSDITSSSQRIGPKRVKTPNLEVEQFDPITLQKLRDRENSVYPTLNSCGMSIAVPNHSKYRTGCERCG